MRGDASSVLLLGFLFLCSQVLIRQPGQKKRKPKVSGADPRQGVKCIADLCGIKTDRHSRERSCENVCLSPPSCPDSFQQVASPPLPASWRTPSAL